MALTRLKSGNLVNLDAVVAVVRQNENWFVRLSGGETFVIDPTDLDSFEPKDPVPQP